MFSSLVSSVASVRKLKKTPKQPFLKNEKLNPKNFLPGSLKKENQRQIKSTANKQQQSETKPYTDKNTPEAKNQIDTLEITLTSNQGKK